jgi:hypothetical protein
MGKAFVKAFVKNDCYHTVTVAPTWGYAIGTIVAHL